MNSPFIPMYRVALLLFWEESEALPSAPLASEPEPEAELEPDDTEPEAELELETEPELLALPVWALFPPRPRLEQEARASTRAPAQVIANIRFIFGNSFLGRRPSRSGGDGPDGQLVVPFGRCHHIG